MYTIHSESHDLQSMYGRTEQRRWLLSRGWRFSKKDDRHSGFRTKRARLRWCESHYAIIMMPPPCLASKASSPLLAQLAMLQGDIPTSMFLHQNLYELRLSGNNLSGLVDLNNFSNLQELHIVDLSDNNIQSLGINEGSVKSFPKDLNLDLSKNQIHGRIPEGFNHMADTLGSLDLSHNLLTSSVEYESIKRYRGRSPKEIMDKITAAQMAKQRTRHSLVDHENSAHLLPSIKLMIVARRTATYNTTMQQNDRIQQMPALMVDTSAYLRVAHPRVMCYKRYNESNFPHYQSVEYESIKRYRGRSPKEIMDKITAAQMAKQRTRHSLVDHENSAHLLPSIKLMIVARRTATYNTTMQQNDRIQQMPALMVDTSAYLRVAHPRVMCYKRYNESNFPHYQSVEYESIKRYRGRSPKEIMDKITAAQMAKQRTRHSLVDHENSAHLLPSIKLMIVARRTATYNTTMQQNDRIQQMPALMVDTSAYLRVAHPRVMCYKRYNESNFPHYQSNIFSSSHIYITTTHVMTLHSIHYDSTHPDTYNLVGFSRCPHLWWIPLLISELLIPELCVTSVTMNQISLTTRITVGRLGDHSWKKGLGEPLLISPRRDQLAWASLSVPATIFTCNRCEDIPQATIPPYHTSISTAETNMNKHWRKYEQGFERTYEE
ncbi:hypothetical protein DEO72_LG7g1858 [Vigna unguiculata]|uniref:LRR receptor-like serine/threonine-protein kinase FLS2 n=1 Tax=Vigna unguiculata TaxID=3917 RepID=A0A4D6MHR8_VIGUN|nr:hypothetical protein DEO72_LG7g1858 [Vigna unguiculata]